MAEEKFDTTIEKAKLAEQTERFDDMANLMKEFVNSKCKEHVKLTIDWRNLLSVAYKNVVGSRRSAWRMISSLAEKDTQQTPRKEELRNEYKNKIEKELKDLCAEVLELLDNLLQSVPDDDEDFEGRVFYLKMKGDYYRYLAEICSEGDEKAKIVLQSSEAYQSATEKAAEHMPPTHPTRLGLALNFSVFYYEIANDQQKACELAKDAFDKAITGLDPLPDEKYKDCTLIMQLLRDNLTLWSSENPDNQD